MSQLSNLSAKCGVFDNQANLIGPDNRLLSIMVTMACTPLAVKFQPSTIYDD